MCIPFKIVVSAIILDAARCFKNGKAVEIPQPNHWSFIVRGLMYFLFEEKMAFKSTHRE